MFKNRTDFREIMKLLFVPFRYFITKNTSLVGTKRRVVAVVVNSYNPCNLCSVVTGTYSNLLISLNGVCESGNVMTKSVRNESNLCQLC